MLKGPILIAPSLNLSGTVPYHIALANILQYVTNINYTTVCMYLQSTIT